MNANRSSCSIPMSIAITVLLLVFSIPAAASAQETDVASQPHVSHDPAAASNNGNSLAAQLHELQTKVAELEAALKQNHQAPAAVAADPASHYGHQSKMKMGSMQGGSMQGMGMMNRGMTGQTGMMPGSSMQSRQGMAGMGMMSGMDGMSSQGMGGVGMDGMNMMGGGMDMMGQTPGMGSLQMSSSLPGFPGASHIYHIGSRNFFLDHPQHITLSQEQHTKLNQIKEQTLLGQATFDRWIDAGEQELWVLTSSDAPDATQIEAKVREIEKLRGDKRIAFIRAVGQAAKILTDEQRRILIGTLPADHSPAGTSGQH